jgi:site-specific DNA recombinase
MFIEGNGYTAIRDALNARGLTTKRGQMFGKNSIHEIIRNEKYTGTYVYNKTAAKSVDGTMNRHRLKNAEEIIRVEDAVPVIIPPETFQRAQAILHSRRHKGAQHKAKESYLLSGKIVCGECGAAFAGNHRKAYGSHPEYTSYRCTRKNNAVKCRNKEVNREEIESLVLHTLAERVFDERLAARLEAEYSAYIAERDKDALAEKALLEHAAQDFERQISNIVSVIAQTGSAALTDKLRDLEQLREETRFQLEKLALQQHEKVLSGEQFIQAFRRAKTLLAAGTLQSKQQLVEQFVEQVIVYTDRVEIKLTIANGFQLSHSEQK